jgi:hypothetical protein
MIDINNKNSKGKKQINTKNIAPNVNTNMLISPTEPSAPLLLTPKTNLSLLRRPLFSSYHQKKNTRKGGRSSIPTREDDESPIPNVSRTPATVDNINDRILQVNIMLSEMQLSHRELNDDQINSYLREIQNLVGPREFGVGFVILNAEFFLGLDAPHLLELIYNIYGVRNEARINRGGKYKRKSKRKQRKSKRKSQKKRRKNKKKGG